MPKTSAAAKTLEPVLAYHRLSKHTLNRFAPGPGTMDWANQPEPFRFFIGAECSPLPLRKGHGMANFPALYMPGAAPAQPFDETSLGLFFELALGLSAWKQFHQTRWALRNTPSSGNLHPSEAYAVFTESRGGPASGVYHYNAYDHVLEQRCAYPAQLGGAAGTFPKGGFLIGLSSIYWREAWKYGERAFRYSQHDLGHAIGAIRFAGAVLGWNVKMISIAPDDLAGLLGLDRAQDFTDAEPERPECLMHISTPQTNLDADFVFELKNTDLATDSWSGRANRLSTDHSEWPEIKKVADATARGFHPPPPFEPGSHTALTYDAETPLDAAALIRQRRSATAMDPAAGMDRDVFFRMLARTLPSPARVPWDAFPYAPRIMLALFVHRVHGLEPGLYLLDRTAAQLENFKAAASHADHQWRRVTDCALPLYALNCPANLQETAGRIACRQIIAANSVFSLGMIGALGQTLKEEGAWGYRRLHWEAGLIGQVLYLEAEAAGYGATGIGCFFDDDMHAVLGFDSSDESWQSLYHFTVGTPVEDSRMQTHPPYDHLGDRAARES